MTGREAIETGQLRALRGLLAAVLGGNAFQRARLEPLKLHLDTFELADLCKLPLTAKAEHAADQRASPPYGSNLTFPIGLYTRFHQTSGTTGQPLRWLDTPESWEAMVQSWVRVFKAAGVGESDRVLLAFSFGPFLGFWLAFEAAQRLGCLTLPGGGLSSLARLRLLLENKATVLCCTPTYALHLASVAKANGIDLRDSSLAHLMVAGEAGGSIPATRQRLESLWPGAKVFDHHGMTEVGPVTFECPARPGRLHVMEDAFIAEIIDPQSLAPVQPGDVGELILTTLRRVASPQIRYRTGDHVRARADAGPCECGLWDLALEGGILGRTDDMVVIRGVNIYPAAVENIVREFAEIVEYQVLLTQGETMASLAVKIELPESSAPSTASRLEERLHQSLALRIPVETVPSGSLPKPEMKAKRWLRA